MEHAYVSNLPQCPDTKSGPEIDVLYFPLQRTPIQWTPLLKTNINCFWLISIVEKLYIKRTPD